MLKGNFLVWSDKLYKTIFWGFFWFFLMQANFFLAWFINLVRAGCNTTKRQLLFKGYLVFL